MMELRPVYSFVTSMESRYVINLAVILFCLVVNCANLNAQDADDTILQVEIITTGPVFNQLLAQRWREGFEKLGESVRIRNGLRSEKPKVEEKSRGPLRIVRLTGELDRDGKLFFPGHQFTLKELDKLEEYFTELRTYGEQGSPAGKPFWGLNEAQFKIITRGLSHQVTQSTKGKTLDEAIAIIPIPMDHKIVFHSDCDDILKAMMGKPILNEVKGISAGSALAAVLSQYGLGFYPLRGPSGKMNLLVQPLGVADKPWSVGWDVDPVQPRNQITPALFKMVNAGFDELTLRDVLEVTTEQTGVPIVINDADCRSRGVDPDKTKCSYPRKKTAWVMVMQNAVRGSRLQFEFKVDEAGVPFIYVFPFIPKKVEKPK